ncbi:helix-turn-helix domain-containing protein [Pseudomonas sp. BIC9C]|uniref:helix-turn-helix domain-containing protein n=1 Tax=Pseudomonas sp. BIC9C TaxID=3078458 RepID=UPI002AD50A5A|nr:helix-turn-helix domain-containing protein [Pseudomonas sp. BIC9C]
MKKASAPEEVTSPSQDHRNTSEAAQVARVLAALLAGPKTTFELRHDYNVLHPAGRVKTLRARGCTILTDRVSAVDREGNRHSGIGRYVLTECGHETC